MTISFGTRGTPERIKFRPLFVAKDITDEREYRFVDDPATDNGYSKLNEDDSGTSETYSIVFRRSALTSSGFTPSCTFKFEFQGVTCKPFGNKSWRTNQSGIERLKEENRLFSSSQGIRTTSSTK